MTSPGPEPEGDGQSLRVRARIAAAGRELFSHNGYERTTVDAIALRAGVGRRTFFRHFRGKDDVIFIDHERVAQAVQAHLEDLGAIDPVTAVCMGIRMVTRSYMEDPQTSVQCYQLIRSVPALRDREIAWVANYERLFARYLRRRLGADDDSLMLADVMASSLVAAHNHALRAWLRAGGVGDPTAAVDAALAWVRSRLSDPRSGEERDAQAERAVVAVFRTEGPLSDVVDRITKSL